MRFLDGTQPQDGYEVKDLFTTFVSCRSKAGEYYVSVNDIN